MIVKQIHWDEKKLARLAEKLEEVEIAEQKAREMADFATAIAKKWEGRMAERCAKKRS